MSSYAFTVRNKETGQLVDVIAMDDCFNPREYGYSVDGLPMREREFFEMYERVKD